MNWYKIAQEEEQLTQKYEPLEGYFSIGHEGYYDKKKFTGNRRCEEQKVWVWSFYEGLKVIDATEDRSIDHNHRDFIHLFPSQNPRGRYEKCSGKKRVSIAVPLNYNFPKEELKMMIQELKTEFGKDIIIYKS